MAVPAQRNNLGSAADIMHNPLTAILKNQIRNSRLRYSPKVSSRLPSGDQKLIQIVDSALAEAAHVSGNWLVCRRGCTQCCIGAFSLNQLDAVRLRRGLADLEKRAPARASRVRQRAREAVARLSSEFPGDPVSGLLDEGEEAE